MIVVLNWWVLTIRGFLVNGWLGLVNGWLGLVNGWLGLGLVHWWFLVNWWLIVRIRFISKPLRGEEQNYKDQDKQG